MISIISMLRTKSKRNNYRLNTVPPKKCLLTSSMKPLQGSLVTKLQDIILGVNHATPGSPDSRSVLGKDMTSQVHDRNKHSVVGLKVPLPEEQPADTHTSDTRPIHPIKHSYHDIMVGATTMSLGSTSCAQTHKIK